MTPRAADGVLGALRVLVAPGVLFATYDPAAVVSFDPPAPAVFAVPALVVGSVVAVVTRRYVPPERPSSEGPPPDAHDPATRTDGRPRARHLAAPVAYGTADSTIPEFETPLNGAYRGSAPLVAITAALAIAGPLMMLLPLIVLMFVVAVFGVLLQPCTIMGDAATTAVPNRMAGLQATGGPDDEPPDWATATRRSGVRRRVPAAVSSPGTNARHHTRLPGRRSEEPGTTRLSVSTVSTSAKRPGERAYTSSPTRTRRPLGPP